MRTRVLWMTVALVFLALPAVAEAMAENEAPRLEAAAEAPRVEGKAELPRAEEPPASVLPGCGLGAILDQPVEEAGLCVICVLTFCQEPGTRCDYISCSSKCCKYNCYSDASCTSGSCFSNACQCRRVILGP